MKKEYHIISFSGGKDSTALLFKMLELNMQIDEVVYCDVVGAEFPEMYEHIEKVKKRLPKELKFSTLRSKMTFEDGIKKYSWSDFQNRWCTSTLKTQVINRYLRKKKKEGFEVIEHIGIAYDEPKRIRKKSYPMVDWKMTEKEALQYCYDLGFDWSGLYESFDRLSCFLCPLQRIGELRTIFNYFPYLWAEMERLDKFSERKFRSDYTIAELRKRFEKENIQMKLFK